MSSITAEMEEQPRQHDSVANVLKALIPAWVREADIDTLNKHILLCQEEIVRKRKHAELEDGSDKERCGHGVNNDDMDLATKAFAEWESKRTPTAALAPTSATSTLGPSTDPAPSSDKPMNLPQAVLSTAKSNDLSVPSGASELGGGESQPAQSRSSAAVAASKAQEPSTSPYQVAQSMSLFHEPMKSASEEVSGASTGTPANLVAGRGKDERGSPIKDLNGAATSGKRRPIRSKYVDDMIRLQPHLTEDVILRLERDLKLIARISDGNTET